jgi:hypothetical protein
MTAMLHAAIGGCKLVGYAAVALVTRNHEPALFPWYALILAAEVTHATILGYTHLRRKQSTETKGDGTRQGEE